MRFVKKRLNQPMPPCLRMWWFFYVHSMQSQAITFICSRIVLPKQQQLVGTLRQNDRQRRQQTGQCACINSLSSLADDCPRYKQCARNNECPRQQTRLHTKVVPIPTLPVCTKTNYTRDQLRLLIFCCLQNNSLFMTKYK